MLLFWYQNGRFWESLQRWEIGLSGADGLAREGILISWHQLGCYLGILAPAAAGILAPAWLSWHQLGGYLSILAPA